MRKEVIFAILIGAIFGVAIVIGIRRLNTSPDSPQRPGSETQEEQQNSEPSEEVTQNTENVDEIFIAVSRPQNKDVLTENPAIITGLTLPEAWIVLISEDENLITQADSNGEFTFEYDLSGGINLLKLTAFNSTGEKATIDLNLVFTSQLDQTNE